MTNPPLVAGGSSVILGSAAALVNAGKDRRAEGTISSGRSTRLTLSTVIALGLLWSIGVDLGGDTLAQHLTGRPILSEGSSAPPKVTFGFDVSVGGRACLPAPAAHLPHAGHRRGDSRRAAAEGAQTCGDAGQRTARVGRAAGDLEL